MKKPKLNLKQLPIPAKVLFARNIVEQMTLSAAAFATPNPPLATITTKAQQLEDAYTAAQNGGEAQTVTMLAREEELNDLLTREASYVSNIAGGDEEVINLAGMQAGSAPSAPQLPGIPQNVKLADGQVQRTMKVNWKNEKNAKAYLIYAAEEGKTTPEPLPSPAPPPTPAPGEPSSLKYELIEVCTAAKVILYDLPEGKRIWVKLFAVGAAGKSGWSDPATRIVQ